MKRMITCIISGNFSLFIILLTIFFIQDVKTQDLIDQYPGIPLIVYPIKTTSDIILKDPVNLVQMEDMGVYGVVTDNALVNDAFIDTFENHHLMVLEHYYGIDPIKNVIANYANSHYTVWEAEGTEPSKGFATLSYDTTYTKYFNIAGRQGRYAGGPGIPEEDTLIYGPGYPQNATYNASWDTVKYTLELKMMIDSIGIPPVGCSTDTVCKVIITNRPDGSNETGWGEEIVIDSLYVKVSDFNGWGNWNNNIFKDYNLNQYITHDKFPGRNGSRISNGSAYFVQFKVIWNGLSYLKLYIDKLNIYDEKGWNLKNRSGPGTPKGGILNLVQYYNNNPIIVGWYGVDEPGSIDNYEPYRIVDSIINAASLGHIRLHSGFTGSWRGTFAYGNLHYGMAHDLSAPVEFWLRAKPKKLEINTYIYHKPWGPWDNPVNPNWIEANIDTFMIHSYLEKIKDYDTSFAVSTQNGAYFYLFDGTCEVDSARSWIIPTTNQLDYHVNLSLMYGARELRLDPYFSGMHATPCTGLYKSKRLQNADSTTLAALRELYNFNLPSISDSVMMKVVSQLSLLTLVDEKQYNEAMLGFYYIINQNPETDEALFAEIDAMTTSLLAQNGNDITLGKSLYKGLLVKGPEEMQKRMNELIKSRFGSEENKSAKEIIPTKYSLYNNYPNPFNPTTTIRFDIPEITNVELNVYNILGQKVKTLISNETRAPGRYEVSFSGNSLASGVYIYRLTTQNFSQSKKMLLIK